MNLANVATMFECYGVDANLFLDSIESECRIVFNCNLGERAYKFGHPDFLEDAIDPEVEIDSICSDDGTVKRKNNGEAWIEAENKVLDLIANGNYDYLR